MNLKLDINSIITAVIIALIMYIGNTVHNLEINQKIIQYQMDQNNKLFQELYERLNNGK